MYIVIFHIYLQPEVVYVFNNSEYSHDTMCGWLLGLDCQHTDLNPWTIEIPPGKPEPTHPEPQQVSLQ